MMINDYLVSLSFCNVLLMVDIEYLTVSLIYNNVSFYLSFTAEGTGSAPLMIGPYPRRRGDT